MTQDAQPRLMPGSSTARIMPEILETETAQAFKSLLVKYDMDGLATITAPKVNDLRKSAFVITPKGRKVVLFSIEKFIWKHPKRENIPVEDLLAEMPQFVKEMWFLAQHEAEIPQDMQEIGAFMKKWDANNEAKSYANAAQDLPYLLP